MLSAVEGAGHHLVGEWLRHQRLSCRKSKLYACHRSTVAEVSFKRCVRHPCAVSVVAHTCCEAWPDVVSTTVQLPVLFQERVQGQVAQASAGVMVCGTWARSTLKPLRGSRCHARYRGKVSKLAPRQVHFIEHQCSFPFDNPRDALRRPDLTRTVRHKC